ncbi:MAG: 50S ribosomal protein L21 [Calditrichaceae bacterium]|nr:50S ribosomal protein L21 [Calditrichia bacterium]NUQ42319.1 50S ribosomal protein L21 [Calditrichaceae bacterium]
MYAIVEIAGQQFRVEKDMTLKVPLLNKEAGDTVEFDRVLMANDGSAVKIGQPLLEGAKVEAKVLEHGRDKKVIVFKKKRRKGYKVKNGHRQRFSKIRIENLAL